MTVIDKEILKQLTDLLREAQHDGCCEASAMMLATADASGQPSLRTVQLKEVSASGLVFFTHCHSRKAKQLEENPQAALCGYWHHLHQQVEIEGIVSLVSEQESDSWWRRRNRDKQIAAWASHQSSRLHDRDALLRNVDSIKKRFQGEHVPRPPHWQGYRLSARRIEFWKSGWRRLHERVCYELHEDGWRKFLLSP